MQFDAKTTLFAAARLQGDVAQEDAVLARFLFELRARHGIRSGLLNAFELLPRQVFFADVAPHLLYAPIALPLPCGEEAEDPARLAVQLALLDLAPGVRVLEIGTGSGFSAGLMARLGARVTSIERYRTLIGAAEAALAASGVTGIRLVQGDGLVLPRDGTRHDRILLHGSVELVPPGLFDRLVEGGLGLGHTRRGAETRLTLWRKDASGRITESDFGTSRAAPLRSGLPQTL